jgi:Na+-translocating ferredoxin:NAD+ oxidoreductase subunit B
MPDAIYRNLARHLDRLPDGFPPSRTGADLRLLQLLFAPEEAALAVHLTLEHESADVIALRAALPLAVVAPRLAEMASKGLIFSIQSEDGAWAYQAIPLVVGIYEMQVNNLTPEMVEAFENYWSTTEDRPQPETIPQMRTIPVRESIDTRLQAMTYEQVNELVNAQTHFAVAPCICRRQARLKGGGCSAPEESCLVFGDWAEFYARTGRGRAIDRAEMFTLLAQADAANLVLQPSNAQDITFICCCCGCCCGVLADLKRHSRPADIVASAFIVALNSATCEACWTCLDRCQMEALVADGDQVALKAERCIGCGLCVTTCPSGSLVLTRKPESARTRVPATLDDTWRTISGAQIQRP